MSTTARTSQSHEERTAEEPRENAIHKVILSKISQVNPTIRLLQLRIPNSGRIEFLAGQWLDVHIPSLPQAGGFTITSTPRDADPTSHPTNPGNSQSSFSATPPISPAYLELAIQKTSNPPAAWLFRPSEEILGTELRVRVGGSFVWPPPGVDITTVQRIVFVAGGVGINPLISILSHLHENPRYLPRSIQFLYTTRPASSSYSSILFLPRLRRLFNTHPPITKTTIRDPAQITAPTPAPDFFSSNTYVSIPTTRSSPSTAAKYLESCDFDFFCTEPISGASAAASTECEKDVRRDQKLQLFLTGTSEPRFSTSSMSKHSLDDSLLSPEMVTHCRRIGHEDLLDALGPVGERKGVVVYICGPPEMTDEFVEVVKGAEGMEAGRVFCEKWW